MLSRDKSSRNNCTEHTEHTELFWKQVSHCVVVIVVFAQKRVDEIALNVQKTLRSDKLSLVPPTPQTIYVYDEYIRNVHIYMLRIHRMYVCMYLALGNNILKFGFDLCERFDKKNGNFGVLFCSIRTVIIKI